MSEENQERSENEVFYDEVIAPELLRLAKLCKDRGMAMIASVEFDYGSTARTETKPAKSSHKQTLVHWAARCHGNVDSLIRAIDKSAQEHGHSSMYLFQLGNKNVKQSENAIAFGVTITTPTK